MTHRLLIWSTLVLLLPAGGCADHHLFPQPIPPSKTIEDATAHWINTKGTVTGKMVVIR
jgi:hypothetical protein